MNGLDVWVANGGRADVLACVGGLAVLTIGIAVVDAIRRRRARPAPAPGTQDDAAFCTADDYPVPSSLTTPLPSPYGELAATNYANTALALDALTVAHRELREATVRCAADAELRALRRYHAQCLHRYRFAASHEFGFGSVP